MRKLLLVSLISLFLPSWAVADPTQAPLIQSSDVTYLGYITMPSNFSQEVRGLAVTPDGTQLYVGQYPSSMGRVNIPSIGGTATQVNAPTSIPGSIGTCSVDAEIGGIVVHNNRVIVSKRCYYNGSGSTSGETHTAGGLNLTGFSSMTRLANITHREQVTGYSGTIPTEWQSLLGGPAFTGNSLMSIITTNSVGPSFFVFNPDDVGVTSPIPSDPLMFFPYGTPMYSPYTADDYLVAADQSNAGIAFPSGFRTAMFIYTHGTGARCYGSGSACNDPCNSYQGEHAYPYRRQVTLFDANEFLAVKNGTKAYHAVRPYGWFTLPGLPSTNCGYTQPGGLAYDDVNRRMYVATEDYWSTRRIHVFQIAGESTEPPADTTPPVMSNGLPTGTLAAGTTQATMSLTTNENATCKWSTSNQTYAAMPNTFTTTGGTSHSTLLTGLTDGTSYTRYARCIDGSGNANASSLTISFSVAEPSGNRIVNVSNLSQLYAAFNNQQQGDEIVIAPGTYTLNTTALPVNVADMVIRGSTGNRDDVIIRGDAMTAGATIKSIFYFQQGAYGQNTTIKDMTIGRVGWHIIFFNGAGSGNGTIVDNVRLYDAYEQMLKGTVVSGVGTNNVTVRNSLFEYTAGQSPQWYTGGIDAHSPNGWLVQGNEFRNIKSPSGSVAEHAVHLWSNTSFSGSNTIERNKIVNCDRGIGVWNNTGVHTIRNNMIMHDGSGSFADVGIDIQNSPNQRVYNNTVWIAPSGYYAAMEFRGSSTTGSVISNNLTSKQIAQFNGASGTKATNIENAQSAWFVNVASDLSLASAVPQVVGQGTAVTGLTNDFFGTLRTGAVDIGAHQWVTVVDPPPVGGTGKAIHNPAKRTKYSPTKRARYAP